MTQAIAEFFTSFTHNDYLTLFLLSIVPIVELRGALVVMAGMPGVNQLAGMFCCVAGSTSVILPLILLIRPMITRLKRSKMLSKLGASVEKSIEDRAEPVKTKSEKKTKRGKKVRLTQETRRFWGLFAFVAAPLPFTGAWTGSAVGAFLEIKLWKAALAVFLGNIVAAGILTGIGAVIPPEYVDFLLYGFLILALAIGATLVFVKLKKACHPERSRGIP